MKPRELPPQVGFNNNVKHRGLVFHIQTEDSGVQRPHVTTHLFVDGGRIVKSQRTDYKHLLDSAELATELRALMKDQHKAMYVALRSGAFDAQLADLFVNAEETAPESSTGTELALRSRMGRPEVSLVPTPMDASSDPLPKAAPPSLPVPTLSSGGVRKPRVSPPASERPIDSQGHPMSSGRLDSPTLPSPEATYAERAAPPVISVSTGAPDDRGGAAPLITLPPLARREPPPSSDQRSSLTPSSSNRGRAPRPAAIFALQGPQSLFGGQAQHEASLDEVILSYLSGDSDSSES